MTEQEAIEQFKERLSIEEYRHQIPEYYEAMELAVKSLEEIQQYRAIGTVKEIKIREAQAKRLSEGYLTNLGILREYQSIGTPEECRAAVEKQKAKKPIRNDKCTCPSCGTHNEVFKKRRNTVAHDIVYCWHCGQAVEIDRLEE